MDTDEEMVLAICAVRVLRKIRTRRRSKNRRYWVHLTHGQFYTIYNYLRADHEKFFNYHRMSTNTFDELLDLLEPHITGQDTNMKQCIPPVEKLSVTLRYLTLRLDNINHLFLTYLYFSFRPFAQTNQSITKPINE